MLFSAYEKRADDPFIPPRALTPELKTINLIVLLFSSSLFVMWFSSSLYLQQVLALSPLETGLVFLPMTLTIFLAPARPGKLAGRAGVQARCSGRPAMLAVGLLLFSRIDAGGRRSSTSCCRACWSSLGIGFSVVSSTIAATQSAGPARTPA